MFVHIYIDVYLFIDRMPGYRNENTFFELLLSYLKYIIRTCLPPDPNPNWRYIVGED